MNVNRLFFLLYIVSMLISCSNNEEVVFTNKSYKEISILAKECNETFSMVLYDTLQVTPKEYLDLSRKYNAPMDKMIYNFISTLSDEGELYYKLLLPDMLPVTCVFNSSGKLIDLFSGLSKEVFLYANKAINTQKFNIDYHYNQRYGIEKKKIVNWINSLLEMNMTNHFESIKSIDTLIKLNPNPYLLFLKMQKQLQSADSISAKETAKELLLFNSMNDIYVYHKELKLANQLIDSSYNAHTGPFLSLETNQIMLSKCNVNQTIDIHVKITNTGKTPLKIFDIQTSCSCLTLSSPRRHIIEPQMSRVVCFEFTPDTEGHIHREICITSNSINLPINIITIEANVTPINN